MRVLAEVWISAGDLDDDGTEYWLEGEPNLLEVTCDRPDEDRQIRIGVVRHNKCSEDVGLYLTESAARDLIVAIAGALAS